MSPHASAKGGTLAIEGVSVVLRHDPTFWLSVLWAGLLVVVICGAVFVVRHAPKGGRLAEADSLTELAAIYGLHAQIKQLGEDRRRLRAERDELLGVLTGLAELLEQGSKASASARRPR